MQKKLIALAVAGLVSGGAFAQSNVTIYGVVDASFESVKADGATQNAVAPGNTEQNYNSRTRVQSNSSYIGFKGTEDLGNGLKAMFQIENQFAVDNAQNGSLGATANSLANRDSFIGLNGNFGTVMMGYLSTPYRALGAKFDLVPGATEVGGFNGLIGHINLGASLNNLNGTTTNTFSTATGNLNTIGRSQALAYASPVFSGFQGTVAYVPNENKAISIANNAAYQVNPSAWNVRVDYDNGPLSVGYSYLDANDPVSAAAYTVFNGGASLGSSDLKSQLFAIGYGFMGGALKVNAMWNQNKVNMNYTGAVPINSASEVKNTVWGLGAKYSMGPHDFLGQYYSANDGSVSNTGTGTQTSQDRGAHQWVLRYGYNFSKRTQAYVQYSEIQNSANGNYDFGAGTAVAQNNAGAVGTLGAGADPKSFGVGLRHNF